MRSSYSSYVYLTKPPRTEKKVKQILKIRKGKIISYIILKMTDNVYRTRRKKWYLYSITATVEE